MNKAIGIHILNFTSIPSTAKYHNVFHITEKESGLVYFKDLELHTIELNKFSNAREELADIVAKVKSSLDIWLAFLTRNDLLTREEDLPANLDDKDLKKALHALDVLNFNEQERDAYEDRLKWLRMEANTLKKYEAKAREEGMAIGEKRGIEKTALKMLQQGLNIDLVKQ
ncbi:MAG: Rpn family recombination-promoting nuclease/putative transposase [Sphingobacteriaceae bacterium]|nr:MAG: Rpn family recombination-promoting nuclease/putative transposase [Sphingobacteriaceae bacterium]